MSDTKLDLGNRIVVVTGLPRSGTSMMMRMLAWGGVPVLVDDHRPSDASNPYGYFEFAPVKRNHEDASWVASALGRAVKVVSPLLTGLPEAYRYEVIRMQRPIPAVLESQRNMLARLGPEPESQPDDAQLARAYEKHLRKIDAWLAGRDRMRVLDVPYEGVRQSPMDWAGRIAAFLAVPLDQAAMAKAVERGSMP